MIVATAGHIDHGKTLLVKALTGTDTDRLPQEKARGISIDLGFAYLPLRGGGLLAFVDVPGHERFVRNMLAGVCGVDAALLVVAADDGVMPQTLEHLNILKLLGIFRGVVVITKIDRVPVSRLREVTGEVDALVAATVGSPWPVVAVCAPKGEGLQALREWLEREALDVSRDAPDSQLFRFAVDRVFVVPGSGTVVTGTVFNGAVSLRERILASGSGSAVRVRGIQIHGAAADRACAGQRCAINIRGADAQQVVRGDWLMDAALFQPNSRFDVRVSVLPGERGALKHWTPLHIHLGSAQVTGRLATRGGRSIEPGASGLAQLVLDHPLSALHADRFILRDQSATRTVAGGIVLDPLADTLRRRDAIQEQRLAALEVDGASGKLAALAQACPHGVDLARFAKSMNLSPGAMEALLGENELLVFGRQAPMALCPARTQELMTAVLNSLSLGASARHGAGQREERLRAILCPTMPAECFHELMRRMADEDRVEVRAGVLYLPGTGAASNPQDELVWPRVEHALLVQGFTPMTPHHIALELDLDEKLLERVLARRQRSGELVKVADRFYLRSTLAALAAIMQDIARQQPDGAFTAAQFRDASSGSRRAAIKVLECFDSFGVTRRSGDARRVGRSFTTLFGAPPEPAERPATLETCA